MKHYFDWVKTLGKRNFIILVCASAVIFSPLGSNFILVINGMFIPEIFVISVILYYLVFQNTTEFRYFISFYLRNVYFLIFIGLGVLLFFIGVINQDDFKEPYGLFRSYFFCVFGYYLMSYICINRKSNNARYFLYTMIFVSTISSIAFFMFINESSSKSAYSIPMIMLFGIFIVFDKNVKIMMLGVVITLFIALTSSFRTYWIIVSLIYLSIFINQISLVFNLNNKNLNDKIKYVMLMFFLPIILFSIYQFFFDDIYNWLASDSSRYHQTIYKTEELINTVLYNAEIGESESNRLYMIDYFSKNWSDFIFPKGFFDRPEKIGYYYGNASPIRDGIYLYQSVIFGVIISLALNVIFIFRVLSSWLHAIPVNRLIYSITIVNFFIMYALNGSVMIIIPQSFYFGFLIYVMYNFNSIYYIFNVQSD
jgi:hypothetical protein